VRIVVAGASGFVGTALVAALQQAGHEVHALVRRAATSASETSWDPAAGALPIAGLDGAGAVVNLSGENVGAGRWSAARRERIRQSRIAATRTLVAAMTQLARPPAVFVSASATGYYGDRGDAVLTEASKSGEGFLPEVCRAWETEAELATRAGIRTARLRFGVVLDRDGGALAKMLPLCRLGLGGRLGSGRQWMSWITRADVVRVIGRVIEDPRLSGAINVVSPSPVTNREFTATLARVLRRPAVLPAPAWALRLIFGQMAEETILASVWARPERLEAAGFEFHTPDLEPALRQVLGC
jgi:uncharacterized protein (TIGR01777 family)